MTSRARILVAAGLAALGVAGCSSVTETPPAAFSGLRDDGVYVLSQREENLDCRRLAAEQAEHVKLMRASRSRIDSEKTDPPRSLVAVFERMTNSQVADSDAETRLKLHQAAVAAFAEQMVRKKCDVDNELPPDPALAPAAAPGPPGGPVAVSASQDPKK